MLLCSIFLGSIAATSVFSCEDSEREALFPKEKSPYFSFIIQAVDDVFNGTLDLRSLLDLLQFEDLNRQLPIFMNQLHFLQSAIIVPSNATTDICGEAQVKSFLKLTYLSKEHSSLAGMLYGCAVHFKKISQILIINDAMVTNATYLITKVFPNIKQEFASKVCDCEKIVEDFKQNCLRLKKPNTFGLKSRIFVTISVFLSMVVLIIGVRKCIMKSKIGPRS